MISAFIAARVGIGFGAMQTAFRGLLMASPAVVATGVALSAALRRDASVQRAGLIAASRSAIAESARDAATATYRPQASLARRLEYSNHSRPSANTSRRFARTGGRR